MPAMRSSVVVCAFLAACFAPFLSTSALPKQHSPVLPTPDQFIVGRHSFFDFGPPTDFYELFVVRSAPKGSSIERISLTPPDLTGDFCTR